MPDDKTVYSLGAVTAIVTSMYNCFCHEVRYVITVLDNIGVMRPSSKKEEINSRPKCYAQRCRGGEHTVVSQGAGIVEKLVREILCGLLCRLSEF